MSSTTRAPGNGATQPDIHNIHSRDNPNRIPPSNSCPMPPGTERCGRCGRPMLRTTGRLRPGFVRHHIRGNCHTCASSLRRPPLPRGGAIKRGRPTNGVTADPVVIYRVLGGERLDMNSAELAIVVDTMSRRGLSAREIATRLGCTADTVHRHRARLRAQQAA